MYLNCNGFFISENCWNCSKKSRECPVCDYKYKKRESFECKQRSGRPPKFSDRDKRVIMKSVKGNPGIMFVEVAQDFASGYSKKNFYFSRTPIKKSLITAIVIVIVLKQNKRIDFAKLNKSNNP